MTAIHVCSEIGQLRRVMLGRPGDELLRIHPFHVEEMCFQDTPYLAAAQREHDEFARILRSCGAEVVYIRDLFAQAMAHPEARAAFVDEFVPASNVCSPALEEAVRAYYDHLPTDAFVEAVFCGIRSDDPFFADDTSLGAAVARGGLFVVEPLPNAYFARDSSINVGSDYILSHMCRHYRQREPLVLKYVHEWSDLYRGDGSEDLYGMDEPWTIEGGDVMVVSGTRICVGCFGRTQPGAIERVAQSLFARGYEAVYAFHTRDPHVMHLDGMLTMLDRDTFMCNAFLKDSVSVYRLVPGPAGDDGRPEPRCSLVEGGWEEALREAAGVSAVRFVPCGDGDMITGRWESSNLGNNHLCVRPGEVVAYDRNPVTLDLLDRAGIKVHAFAAGELSRGKGGPRCMSMPIWRDDL